MKAFIMILLLLVSGLSKAQDNARPNDTTYQFNLQGHRGARGLMPENTIPAFQKALQLGVNTLELDVVISKDHQVVVSHEPWINQTICLGKNGKPLNLQVEKSLNLYQMDYTEIQQFDCGSLRHPNFYEQQLQSSPKPLLKDVVKLIKNYNNQHQANVALNIELKSDEQGDGVFHPHPKKFVQLVINEIKHKQVDFSLQSFDFRILRYLHENYPTIKIAALTEDQSIESTIKALGFQPDIFSPHYFLVDQNLIAKAHEQGIKVIPWTVNQPEDMHNLLKLGVDGLITDYPDKALVFKKNN